MAAQAISDAAVALLVVAYAHYGWRTFLGAVSVPLFLYFIAWEALVAWQRWDSLGETQDNPLSDAELFGGTAHWLWDAWNLAPAFVIGALVAGTVVMPTAYSLPGTPSPLSCEPAEPTFGDDVVLRMRTPHGGDLGVFTPHSGYLLLRSTPAAGTVPEAQRFEHQPRLGLSTTSATGRRRRTTIDVPIFADSGTYTFSLSDYQDPSVESTCAVHYRP